MFIKRLGGSLCATLALLSLVSCSGSPSGSGEALVIPPAGSTTQVDTYTVVETYPHDSTAFTQGLFYENGFLYESTGLYGQSSLRQQDLTTGNRLKTVSLSSTYFGEGITSWNGTIYQLTWKNEVGFLYNQSTFERTGQFTYQGEGWALTHDTESLIMSNGSDAITFRDPTTFAIKRTIHISDHGARVTQLNELEYIKGEIFANVWRTNYIARIDPQTGAVKGWIDLTGIQPGSGDPDDVLNGIAYDATADRLFVTGKRWPQIFQITLKPRP
ncbi:MAG: glutaminyl-peptide cyclotransferase [Armatimonas sp.]